MKPITANYNAPDQSIELDLETQTALGLPFKKYYMIAFPVAFHTVDMAIIRTTPSGVKEVLLAQKKAEIASEQWRCAFRFPGGFVDPTDSSDEAAAFREALEETGMQFNPPAVYIGSTKIDDARYRDPIPHKIITCFFELEYKSGDAGKGFDDIAVTKWFPLHEIFGEMQNPIHDPLFNMLAERYAFHIKAAKLADEFYKTAMNGKTKIEDAAGDLAADAEKFMDSMHAGLKEAYGHLKNTAPDLLTDASKSFWDIANKFGNLAKETADKFKEGKTKSK